MRHTAADAGMAFETRRILQRKISSGAVSRSARSCRQRNLSAHSISAVRTLQLRGPDVYAKLCLYCQPQSNSLGMALMCRSRLMHPSLFFEQMKSNFRQCSGFDCALQQFASSHSRFRTLYQVAEHWSVKQADCVMPSSASPNCWQPPFTTYLSTLGILIWT